MKHLLPVFIFFFALRAIGQQTIQERLGYDKNTKLLIIHADDLGMSHAENMAGIESLEKKYVSSGSIMVPCPWFPEIAAYAAAHPEADLGLHLTLTSEWKYYKWGAVSGASNVPGLHNKNGFLYSEPDSVVKIASLSEIEKELRAQINRAIAFGIHPTHLDSHMGTCFMNKDVVQIYLKLAREYHLPCLLNRAAFQVIYHVNLDELLSPNDVVLDNVFMAFANDYNPKTGMSDYYTKIIRQLKAGLNCILLHAAFDNEEMRGITVDHADYGAAWRQADYNFFSSKECSALLKEEHVQVISWKEIKEKLFK